MTYLEKDKKLRLNVVSDNNPMYEIADEITISPKDSQKVYFNSEFKLVI